MAKRKYPGALGEPMPQPSILEAVADPQGNEKYILRKQSEALNLLFKYYGIAADHPLRFELLAMSLAYEHVPAFKFAWGKQFTARGRPRKGNDIIVYVMVDLLHRQKPDSTISEICLSLAKKRGTQFTAPTGTSSGKHAKTLADRYYRHRKRLGLGS